MARWGRGSGRQLFPLVVLLGAVIAALFANDGAALLLTPIVLSILLRLRFPSAAALAFTVACGFIADTASLPLVVSNLVNIVTANFFGISFGTTPPSWCQWTSSPSRPLFWSCGSLPP